MNLMVAIVGEAWEAAFARATAGSMIDWLPSDAEVCIPTELESHVADFCPRSLRVSAAIQPGFQGYGDLRRRVLQEAGPDKGVLLLAAGTLPLDHQPLECLGASQRRERVFEWYAPTEEAPPSVLRFQPPPHYPPARPHHKITRVGALDLWTIDGDCKYFQGLARLNGARGLSVWPQYGPHRPVFMYNTNEFEEPPVVAHDDYFILGSGLLGLRMVAESKPAAGARVVVYDINPDQLLWTRLVLEVCENATELEEVNELFRSRYPSVEVRTVLPHEEDNVKRQANWYGRNRERLVNIKSSLLWEFVECDLWSNPATLLDRIRPARSLFFMYLDLFIVWRIEAEKPWVEDHVGVARSLEAIVRERAKGSVTFLPGPHSVRFQLHPGSPFACARSSS